MRWLPVKSGGGGGGGGGFSFSWDGSEETERSVRFWVWAYKRASASDPNFFVTILTVPFPPDTHTHEI